MKKKFLICLLAFFAHHVYAQDTIPKLPPEESLKTLPVLWMQTAAEYRALCYQAFNTAQWRLEKLLKKKKRREHWAIITDLDETILDNSYEEARRIKSNKDFNNTDFNKWINESAATEVPGATKFLQWVHSKGISIFYVSNRKNFQTAATILNLQKLQLPDADTAHMLLQTDTSSKEVRRQNVTSRYKVVMLCGDNLNDFTSLFELRDIATRKTETDNAHDEWGSKFIVLPNATYGEWENALYNYLRPKPAEKDAKRKELLKENSL